MRILHTSDWHIGRTFHGNSTMDALAEVLGALTVQVRENAVDVVIVAESKTSPAPRTRFSATCSSRCMRRVPV